MSATTSTSGSWSILSGSGIFDDVTDPETSVSNLSYGDNVFQWSLDDQSCSSQVTITNNELTEPIFDPVDAICINDALDELPLTSINGISGTWSPAINNTQTTTYTFTPNSDECATNQTITIQVTPLTTPLFDTVEPICIGETIQELPQISNNGIAGTWAPAINNIETTTYTFTPNNDACASQVTMTIIVGPSSLPLFDEIEPVCSGDTIEELSLISNNGIAGTWTPSLNNLETTTYTFTPNIYCGDQTTLAIVVNQLPNFEIISDCNGNGFNLLASIDETIDDLTFEWLNSNNTLIGTNDTIAITESGTYYLMVSNEHCSTIKSIEVDNSGLNIPQGISPNGDNYNDYFDLSGLSVKHLSIFNRYGTMVFEKRNYTNEWNGNSMKGTSLPSGTYFYVAEFENCSDQKGWVYLNR